VLFDEGRTWPLLLPDGERACQFETNKSYYDTEKWVRFGKKAVPGRGIF